MSDLAQPSIVERMKGHATYGYMPHAIREVMGDAAAQIETLQAELAEARAKVEAVIIAVQAYLPPDGIGKDEFISRVIAAVDTPLKEIEP